MSIKVHYTLLQLLGIRKTHLNTLHLTSSNIFMLRFSGYERNKIGWQLQISVGFRNLTVMTIMLTSEFRDWDLHYCPCGVFKDVS